MKKQILATIVIAVAVLGAIFGYKYLQIKKGMAAQAHMVRPPVTVSALTVHKEPWPNTLSAVGTLASFRGITVKTEIEGAVRRVAFESGAAVEQGTLLVELDDSIEAAQLPGLEAQAKYGKINLARALELRTNNTNTEAELDVATATAAQAQSALAQLRATLAKKRITAPFTGRLGIARVYPGQFLGKAESIVDLETLNPIHADFTLPQQDISRVAVGQAVRVHIDAFADRAFSGTITAIAPRVDDATRSISLRATIDNPEEALRPGMFGQVEIVLPSGGDMMVLPTAAIVYNPYGNFVYVIEKGVAQQRFVQTGPERGSLVAILSGLKPGEMVVTSGQIKLRNGSPVQVNNTVTPSANPNPNPGEG